MDFKGIELILVDDKSTDSTPNIINRYAEKYTNIKPIFLEKNSGRPGIPKNIGIKNSTAPFLMFFDPDDELLDDICETLYNKIIDTKADVVSGNAVTMNHCVPYIDLDFSNDTREVVYPTKEYSEFKNFRCWGSIFNKDFILKNNISFSDNRTNEDTYFVNKAFFSARKICYIDDYYGLIYYIRDNSKSLTHRFSKDILVSTIDAFLKIKKQFIDMDVKITEDVYLLNIYARFGVGWDCAKKEEFEIYEKILEYRNSYYYPTSLPIHHKAIDKLIATKHFSLLYYYHKFSAKLFKSNFIKSLLPKRVVFNKITEDNPIYEKIKDKLYN